MAGPTPLNAFLSELYDLLCTGALNRDYYGRRLATIQSQVFLMEFAIAVTTTGSALSASALWKVEPWGPAIWTTATSIAAALAIVKPIWQPSRQIERWTRLHAGYSELYAAATALASRVKREGALTQDLRDGLKGLEDKLVDLAKSDDPSPNRKLLARCEAEVRARHPADQAWYADADA